MSVIGYIKTTDNESDYKLQHKDIMAFAASNGLVLSCVCADVSFENIKSIILPDYKGIIVSTIASLGSTLPTIRDNLYFCKEKGLSLYSVSEDYHFTTEHLTEERLQGFDLAIDIRYQMTSVVTKKALAKKKASGFQLGRKGKPNRSYVLSGREHDIYRLLESGMPKKQIAKELGVCAASLYNFLKRNT